MQIKKNSPGVNEQFVLVLISLGEIHSNILVDVIMSVENPRVLLMISLALFPS
jgi:hypothetical protein